MNLYQAIQIHKYMTLEEAQKYDEAIHVILNHQKWYNEWKHWLPIEKARELVDIMWKKYQHKLIE
jgi:ribosomal protein L11 methylase PrmA